MTAFKDNVEDGEGSPMSSIGKISSLMSDPSVQGWCSIAVGSTIIWKSGTIQSCLNWFQKEHPPKGQKIKKQLEARVKPTPRNEQSTNLSMAVLGVGLMIGGVMRLTYGGGPVPQLPLPPYLSETEGMPCKERLDRAFHNIRQCSHSKALYNKVQANGDFTVACVPRSLAWNGAKMFPSNRTIFIAEDNSVHIPRELITNPNYKPVALKTTGTLLYELKNLQQAPKFLNLMDGAKSGSIKKSKFVYEIESTEYETARSHHQISKKCMRETGWDPIIAERFDEKSHAKRTFSPMSILNWIQFSEVAEHVNEDDSLEKITYIMRNELSGHVDKVRQLYDQIIALRG